jgi:ABC-type transport system substrate-binding protein
MSTRVAQHIFEALYQFDYLATTRRGSIPTPRRDAGHQRRRQDVDDQRAPGHLLHRRSRVQGKRRELVAEDYCTRSSATLDPHLRNGGDPALTDLIAGARAVVDAAKSGRMDYDQPIGGLRALDRYTLQIGLTEVDYTLLERLAGLPAMAVAREVVEAAGNDIMSHPVGTGPYRLKEWRRASRVVLEANPDYRTLGFPDSDRPEHRALVASMRGRKLPQIGRIEISIIEESQPQILAFEQGDLDLLSLGGNDLPRVMERDALRPDLARLGVKHVRFHAPSITFTYFNLDDPTVGGYTQQQVALRRAIAMGFNTDEMIRVLFAGQALPANQLLPPGSTGFDAALPVRSLYDPAAARALLDRFGFKDRNGDGYRETPDGKPLVVRRGTLPESWYREADTLFKKNMDAIGIRMEVEQHTFAELVNMSRAGKLPMFNLGYRSLEPSGFEILETLWSKSPDDINPSRLRRPEYDAAYEEFLRTPDGPRRTALVRRMSEVTQAYMPLMLHTFGVGNVLHYPWLEGYWPSAFGFSWKYLDIDLGKRRGAGAAQR